jgi:hypothetical protein
MICPRCASNQSDNIKFCTSCGANLHAVRKALDARGSGKKVDSSDTCEVKRYNEIKAGVITSSVGVGIAIFLFIFMQGVAGRVDPDVAQIITRLWIAGIIPFMVGVALIINGLVVSKKMVEIQQREQQRETPLEEGTAPRGLRSADTSEFIPAGMSVTDQTTRHLQNSERKSS